MKNIDYNNPKYFENRELSWIKFNERVLSEAYDDETPLFERLKFLSITASNLDEFIMVRVASIRDLYNANVDNTEISGLKPLEQLKVISAAVHELVSKQYYTYNECLVPKLKDNGLEILAHHEDLNENDKKYVDEFFMKDVYPVLTPMAVDSSRPFPLIRNRSLNIGALVTKKNSKNSELEFATVQVPSVLKRFVELPSANDNNTKRIIFLEEIIERNMDKLFLNYDIVCAHPFRIMRDADFSVDEDEVDDLLKEIERQVRMRQWGAAIRLDVEAGMDKRLAKIIRKELMINDRAFFEIAGPLDLTVLMDIYGMDGFEAFKERSYKKNSESPKLPKGCNIFEAISKDDILLFHPYESFDPIVDFVSQASKDENVLAIKQTLYRVSGNSPIIAALAQAAENGKQVTVLVELKARFDEENNIIWAHRLEQAGCHVIYGLVGLKTHSKITLVVRREEDGIKRYVHLGTGNYNDSTAKLYTDVGLLTADEAIGEDATAVFNMLSGYSEPLNWNGLVMAPLWLKDRFIHLINREKEHALAGRSAHMIVKMNSICDPDIMIALYEAASAGVRIDLIVRGICCLKLDTPEINGNIKIRSIVGNFLEHARIFYFENGGKEEFYCASADWMPRNLERRVEILFPVRKKELCDRLRHILTMQLRDNQKAHEMQKDGKYMRVKDIIDTKGVEVNSQLIFGDEAFNNIKVTDDVTNSRVFIPKTSPTI